MCQFHCGFKRSVVASEDITAMIMTIVVLWVVRLCSLVLQYTSRFSFFQNFSFSQFYAFDEVRL
jgi:hypothetical protein